jgi:hypothetical protein
VHLPVLFISCMYSLHAKAQAQALTVDYFLSCPAIPVFRNFGLYEVC